MIHIFQQYTFNQHKLLMMHICRIICMMLLTAHYMACFWFMIGEYAHSTGNSSWIDGITEESPDNVVKYSYSFYWAIVTLFTTGYGDISAHNIYEQWTCSICILIGSCFFAYFIGVITTFLGESHGQQHEKERIEDSLLFCDR